MQCSQEHNVDGCFRFKAFRHKLFAYIQPMENETFSSLSKEYYEILHDIDHICQTFRRQGKLRLGIV